MFSIIQVCKWIFNEGIYYKFDFLVVFSKENTVLRANVEQDKVSVIPNALDTSVFKPDISARVKGKSKLFE